MSRYRTALARKLYSEEPMTHHRLPKSKKRRKSWWNLVGIATGFVCAVTVLGVLYLNFCARIVQEQYAFDKLEAVLPVMKEQNANLEIQVKELSRPARIDQIARHDLHMDFPKQRLMIQEMETSEDTTQKGERVSTTMAVSLP